MKIARLFTLAILAWSASLIAAGNPATFDEAKALSVQLKKPILLEFVHED
jgi:hypothetical protein